MPSVGLLTDSTWSLALPDDVDVPLAVVPLHVHCGAVSVADTEANQDRIDEILAAGKTPTTSQPSPAEIRSALEQLQADGAEHIIAVHLSGGLSGTCDAVRAVGECFTVDTEVPVDVIDSRSFGAGTGFGVLAAAGALAAGGTADDAIAAARRASLRATSTLAVRDLRHLQRGGRLRAPQVIVGQALGVRPLLTLRNGTVEVATTVRGAKRLREALISRVLADARAQAERSELGIDLAVHHAPGAEGMDELVEAISRALEDEGITIRSTHRGRASSVLSVHGGPGAYVVVTAPSER